MRSDSLVKMANQISVSVPDQATAAEQTAAHLRAFWSPAMIDALHKHVDAHPDSVTPAVVSALDLLRPEHAHG